MRVNPLWRIAPACAFVLAACAEVGIGTDVGSSGSTTGGTSSTAASAAATPDASTGGSGCTTDPASGVTLCEQLSVCAGVDVDPGGFPNCGFRLRGAGTIDLECLCNGESLCPIGVPTTCAEAVQLLGQAQGALTVCQEVDQGGCLQVGGADAGTQSSCDRACESECQSDPGCVSLCGC